MPLPRIYAKMGEFVGCELDQDYYDAACERVYKEYATAGAILVKPRPYQQEALDALDHHLATRQDNPCVVLPTGAGKSPVIAWAITQVEARTPPVSLCDTGA
jgi:superfamily II DNA or RNA helicase